MEAKILSSPKLTKEAKILSSPKLTKEAKISSSPKLKTIRKKQPYPPLLLGEGSGVRSIKIKKHG